LLVFKLSTDIPNTLTQSSKGFHFLLIGIMPSTLQWLSKGYVIVEKLDYSFLS